MKRHLLFSLFALGVFVNLSHADDKVGTDIAQKPDARFMLRNTDPSDSLEKKPSAEDFTWAALTTNGPANGANPVIGEKSGKARYDFKDGLPHPYYITPEK